MKLRLSSLHSQEITTGLQSTLDLEVCHPRCVVQQQIKRVYLLFSLTQLYLPSAIEYNTTCFGPRCGPSSGVTYR